MKCKKVLAALTAAAVVSGVPMISALADQKTITEYDFDTSKSTPEGHSYDVKENNVNEKDYGKSAWLKQETNKDGANQLNVNAPYAGYESAVFSFEAGRASKTGALRLVLVGSDSKQYFIVQIAAGAGSIQKFDNITTTTASGVTEEGDVRAKVGHMHKITCVVEGNQFTAYISKGEEGAIEGPGVGSLQSDETYGYELYSGSLPKGVSVKTFRLHELTTGGVDAINWQWMIDNVSLTADYGSEDKINTLDKLKSAIESEQGEITIPDNTELSIAAGPGEKTTQLILKENQRIIVPEGSYILGFGTIFAEKDGSAVVYKKAGGDYSFTGKLTYDGNRSQPHPINDNTMCVSSDGMTGFIQSVKDFTGKTKVTITTLDEKTAELSLEERFPTMTGGSSVVFGLIITDAGNTKITSVTVK